MKSLSEKRLIIICEVNGKKAPFLIDTGAAVSLIDENAKSEYTLSGKKKFKKTLVGIGGSLKAHTICDNFVRLGGKDINQFVFADISGILESIAEETNIHILGVIGLPQLRFAGIKINLATDEVYI